MRESKASREADERRLVQAANGLYGLRDVLSDHPELRGRVGVIEGELRQLAAAKAANSEESPDE